MKTVICDLDGTLANIDHRLHFLKDHNWNGFFAAVKDDTPNDWCITLIDSLLTYGIDVVFVSGRNESARPATEVWLKHYGLGHRKLYMRPEKDRRPDFELKAEIYEQHLKDLDIVFVVEDRKQVVDMWRSKGLTVLHCDDGEF